MRADVARKIRRGKEGPSMDVADVARKIWRGWRALPWVLLQAESSVFSILVYILQSQTVQTNLRTSYR